MPRIRVKERPKERLLIPREKYLAAGVHISTTTKTAHMKKFVYRVRPNGLAVMNIADLDRRIRYAAELLATSRPLVVCRKELGWQAVKRFSEVTGIPAITGRFMPGSLTNPNYASYSEPNLLLVVDPVLDAQATREAASARIPVIGMADTSHDPAYIDFILPCNTKGKKALALLFWGLATALLNKRGQQAPKLEEFGWQD